MVSPDEAHPNPDSEADLLQLRQQLQLRDQLVDQLSFELFQAMRAHPPALAPARDASLVPPPPSSTPTSDVTSSPSPPASEASTDQVRALEEQIEFYQQQIDQRDTEINRLQQSCQSLSDRNHMLEHVIQELPDVYRQKFADRLSHVKTKVESLQLENQRLQSQLQGTSPPAAPAPKGFARRLLPSWGKKATQKK